MRRIWLGMGSLLAVVGTSAFLLAGNDQEVPGWEPINTELERYLAAEARIEPGASSEANSEKEQADASSAAPAAASDETGSLGGVSDTVIIEANGPVASSGAEPVPTPAASTKETSSSAASDVHKININTATVLELTSLPGIGDKKAQAIVDYRNQKGPFTKVSDLVNVKGIGPKILEKLSPYVDL